MLGALQIDTIIKDLKEVYGHDFGFYARDSFERRVNRVFKFDKFETFHDFRTRLRSDKEYIQHFIDHVTVNVTEMFRDAAFYKAMRESVIPRLSTLPLIRIWHAGCSTGEEVYSTAILLHEAGLLKKCRILATDINSQVVRRAEIGIFQGSLLTLYEKKYLQAGGKKNFREYYSQTEGGEKINSELSSQIKFQVHNLASGEFIDTFDLIICRNVLIYFDQPMREMVFRLFDESSTPHSIVALGERETMEHTSVSRKFSKTGQEMIWEKTN